MKENKALDGQLKLHWDKVELIREFNPDLAQRITEFTNVLVDNDFKGVFSVDDDVYHNGIGISQSRFSSQESVIRQIFSITLYIASPTNSFPIWLR